MLIRFKVGNYLSFNETQELSMVSGETKNHQDHIHRFDEMDVLRASAIYGANASGKSNLIKAFKESRKMIVYDKPIHSNRYFRPSSSKKEQPSYFEYEFENEGQYFSYGFEFLLSKQKIESEWLYGLSPNEESKVFFQRAGNKIEHFFEGDEKNRMDVYVKDMENSDNTLFLYEMGRKMGAKEDGLSALSEVFKWFLQKVVVLGAKDPLYRNTYTEEKERHLVKLLEGLGTGITDVRYEEVDIKKTGRKYPLDDIRDELIKLKKKGSGVPVRVPSLPGEFFTLSEKDELVLYKQMFRHGAPDVSYEMGEESDGTQRLYYLLDMIVNEKSDNVYIWDELDSSLHPQLTFRFVKLFLEKKAGTKSQLIFTSHESNLIDFSLLRRDEIWFVEKDEHGSSILYSLEDFNERTDRKIDKAYLEGRYGGVPIFSTLFPVSGGDVDEVPKK